MINPSRNQVARSLRYCVDKYNSGSISRFASRFKLTDRVLRYWLRGTQRPILETVLQLTYKIGVSPVNFLCGKLKTDGFPLHNISEGQGRVTHTSAVKQRLSYAQVKKVLLSASSSDRREPLRTVVRITGWHEQTVRHHFAELCAAIVTRHAEFFAKRFVKSKALPVLKAALKEIPPPTIVTVAERIGSGVASLRYHFRELTVELANRRRADRKRVEMDLKKILLQDPPLSLGQTARSIGISARWLRIKFPDLIKVILMKFKEHTRTQKKSTSCC